MELDKKRALVIGGTSGIGLATVQQLAAAGAEVIAAGRSQEKIGAARSLTGDTVHYHSLDTLDRDALTTFFDQQGPFDILVNTTVPAKRAAGPFAEMDLDLLQSTFDKLWGYVNSVHLGLTHLTENASIVLISGFPARKSPPGFSAIGMVGSAVEGFVRNIAPEIAPKRINAVSPGLIDTPMFPQEGEARNAFFAERVGHHAIPRPGTPDEVANAILFLLRNDFTTGTIVDVDGGALLP